MIYSMTGYGRGQYEEGGIKYTVEIRSVNHRFLDIYVRMPKYLSIEEKIKSFIKQRISRGRVDVYVNEERGEEIKTIEVDKNLSKAYYYALEELKKEFRIQEDISLSLLASFPDVLVRKEVEKDEEALWGIIQPALDEALSNLIKMRMQEGRELAQDIEKKLEALEKIVSAIKERAPKVVAEYREKLKDRIKEIFELSKVDEQRLEEEVVIFAERSCIDEELVRIKTHIEQFKNNMTAPEPKGRKLDFILQEMHREANTIGSKSQDVEIKTKVIDLKSEIEKLREQVQNIE